MRQGDGSDVLGPGDPRNSDIGILYVEARDNRQAILTAINTQEVQGRKQIAIVLPEQGKAFRHPLDFDGLKNIRRQLRAQLIFIVPSGRGPAELARQRRFAVYSSLAIFKTALLNEDISMINPRGKSQPGSTKRHGILDFGGRKGRKDKPRVPATPKLMQPTPPTPRLHDQPTPLIMPQLSSTPYIQGPHRQEPAAQDMPPTPPHPGTNWPDQAGISNMPPTPHLPDQPVQPATPAVPPTPHLSGQWDIPTPRVNETHLAEATPAGSAPNNNDNAAPTNQGTSAASDLFADERMTAAAAGILAASSLESDDDALYVPLAPQQKGALVPTNLTFDDLADAPTPHEPSLENQPTPRIIAFPEEPATPKETDKDKATSGTANALEGNKLPTAHDPASLYASPGTVQNGSGKYPTAPRPICAQGASGPANVPGNGEFGTNNTGKIAALGAPGIGTIFNSTGNIAAPGTADMAGKTGGVNATSGGPGPLPARPLYRRTFFASSPAANQPVPQAPAAQWGASRFGGASMSPRPSGLTPLPPPYSRRARRRRNRTLLLLTLLFLLCALTIVGVFAQRSQMPGGLSATVTLIPASKLETDNYLLSALPTGTPDPAHLQIAARLLTQNAGTSTTTANASGSVAAKAATGTLVFFNSTGSGITLGSTTFTGKDGVQIRFNGPVFVPATGSASTSTPGYAVSPGSRGNIPAFDIGGPCCASERPEASPMPSHPPSGLLAFANYHLAHLRYVIWPFQCICR